MILKVQGPRGNGAAEKKPASRRSLVTTLSVLILLGVIIPVSYACYVGLWRDVIRFCAYFFEVRRLEAFISSYGTFAALILIGLEAFQVIIAPLPGQVTGFVSGYLFGAGLGTVLSTIGLTLGSLVAFFTARLLGTPFVEKIVKKKYRDEFDGWVTQKGLYIVFVLFLIPGFPKDSLCYLLGLTTLGVVPFILMNVFGRLPGTLLLTLQGSAVTNRQYKVFFILLGCSLLMTAVMYLMRNHCEKAANALVCKIIKRKKGLPAPVDKARVAERGGALY